MSELQVLLVAGTHGNEINAPWLMDQWQQNHSLINTYGLRVAPIIGNPAAREAGRRYLDCDLNRSFKQEFLKSSSNKFYEHQRAKELLSTFGERGLNPCQLCIDLHSTTAAMGTSLVVYGRRGQDLALASLMQNRLGIPIYLHEGDRSQQGFLVESWPCGFVIEIGPVPQSVLSERIVNQTKIAVEVVLEEVSKVKLDLARFPKHLVVHRHLQSLDFPRDSNGQPDGCIHPSIQGKDWIPIEKGSPLFIGSDGNSIQFSDQGSIVPVFVNEAAYVEKRIAMSLTKREIWPFSETWYTALKKLLKFV